MPADDQGTAATLAQTVASVAALVTAIIPGGAPVAPIVGGLMGLAAKLLEAHAAGTLTPEMREQAHAETTQILADLNSLRSQSGDVG